MSSTFLSGLLGTLKSTFRINKATLDASGLSAARSVALQDLAGLVALSQRLLPVLGVTPSADQNDYSPSGLADAGILRVNASASIKITGLTTGADGRIVTIWNASTDYLLWLEHENTSSSAANRFTLPKGFPAFLMPADTITLLYDATVSRWVVWHWPTQGPAMGLVLFSDFIEATVTVAANASPAIGIFGASCAGTAATIQTAATGVNTTERAAGVLQLDTGTTATGRSTIGNVGNDQIVPTLGAALSVARIAVETTVSGTETFQVISGFANSADGAWDDGVAWENRWTGAAAEWSQTRMANTTATRSATGSPTPNNNYIWLVVFINPAWTRADFIYSTDSLSFVKADSPTTGFPSNSQLTSWTPCSIVKSLGGTSRAVSIDLAGYRLDSIRA